MRQMRRGDTPAEINAAAPSPDSRGDRFRHLKSLKAEEKEEPIPEEIRLLIRVVYVVCVAWCEAVV
jgi:hypothetical protein